MCATLGTADVVRAALSAMHVNLVIVLIDLQKYPCQNCIQGLVVVLLGVEVATIVCRDGMKRTIKAISDQYQWGAGSGSFKGEQPHDGDLAWYPHTIGDHGFETYDAFLREYLWHTLGDRLVARGLCFATFTTSYLPRR
eukprot:SAG11_NODE_29_length_23137_cov_16.739995_6_plen_139_part_00